MDSFLVNCTISNRKWGATMKSINSYAVLDDSKLSSINGGHNKLAYKVGHIVGEIAAGVLLEHLL